MAYFARLRDIFCAYFIEHFLHIMLKKICKTDTEGKVYEYYCESCDYGCHKKFLYTQHINTKKHQRAQCSKNAHKNMQPILQCDCGRRYRHIQSYNRHQRTCPAARGADASAAKNVVIDDRESERDELRTMITTLIRQNQAVLMENKEMRGLVGEMMPKIGNNNTTINNRFNLQVFLKEQCKDAINLSEFVDSLRLELGDLAATSQVGFAGGVAKIFVQGLQELELHHRPIHCSDLKREVLYVKDNDTWERDSDDNSRVKAAISAVARRQIGTIKDWEAAHPDWNKTDEGTQQYIRMIRNVTGPDVDSAAEDKIIRTIAKEVAISKDNALIGTT